MAFVILGPTALYLDGRSVPLGAAKQRAMLAILLYYVGAAVRIDTLVEELWGYQRGPTDHRANLYALASRIRAVLAQAGISDGLLRLTGAYRLDLEPTTVDYHWFKQLVRDAREAAARRDPEAAIARLVEATGLWRGEPLADLRGAHSEHLRRHMTEALLDAHKLLADCQLATGEHLSVLARLEPLVHANDLDEALAQRWIAALCASGRDDDAHAYLVAFRRRFRKEFRTEPAATIAEPRHRPVPVRAPARAPVSVPRQLPRGIPDFIGHEDLLMELDSISDGTDPVSNTVVLSGMPGVGKTTLAVHWAQQRADRFPDGQLYLNANGFGTGPPMDPAAAMCRLLTALDTSGDQMPATLDQRRDRLNEILSERRMLIVLDNVRDSSQVRPLIPTSTKSFVVITSRTRLRSLTIREGVRCLTVPPLPHPDCLTLLTKVIGVARAGVEPAAVRALAHISCGLPLALRVMGQRVAEWPGTPISELVDELNAHLLTAEGGEDEEASLYSVFAWSYQALRPEVAHLFRLLGLAPTTTVSLDAAAAMVAVPAAETHVLLADLVRAHLLRSDTVRQYSFHDLLRRYAADQAVREEPDDERHDAVRRLLDWYLLSAANAAAALAPDSPPVPDLPDADRIRPLTFATDGEAMKWSEAERSNIAALARWAGQYHFHRHAWQLVGTVHEIYDRYGRQDDVLALNTLALGAARSDGHKGGEIGTLINVSATHFALRDYPAAVRYITDALRLAREVGDADAEVGCLHNLASIHLRTGRTTDAIRIYTDVLGICRRTANGVGEASSLHRLGMAYRQIGRREEAIRHYREALTVRERIGSLRGQGETLGELAAAYLESGATTLALEHCRSAVDIDTRTKDDAALCDALTTMAEANRALGALDEAAVDAGKAVALAEEIGDRQRQCLALVALADAMTEGGDVDGGRQARTHARQLLTEVPDEEAGPLRQRLAADPAS